MEGPRGHARRGKGSEQGTKDKPWASRIAHAWLAGEATICDLMAKLPSDLGAWQEAAELLPELRNWMSPALLGALESMMWRVLAGDLESFLSRAPDADAARDMGCADELLDRLHVGRSLVCPGKPSVNSLDAIQQQLNGRAGQGMRQKADLYRAAAIVDNMLNGVPRDAIDLLRAIQDTSAAAKECQGLRLGTEKPLFSTFCKLGDLADMAAARGWYGEWAAVAQASVDCALVMADVMVSTDPLAEILSAVGKALRRLPVLAATVQAKAASAEFGRLGLDFEARYEADHSRFLVRVLEALDVLDEIHRAGDDGELHPVDAARNIKSEFGAFCERKALESIATAQAELTSLFRPCWKRELAADASWDRLMLVGGEFLRRFRVCEAEGAACKLQEAGPAAQKQAKPSNNSRNLS